MRQQRQQKRHRYVLEEPHIPFECEVLYENDAIIVVERVQYLMVYEKMDAHDASVKAMQQIASAMRHLPPNSIRNMEQS